MTGRLRVMTFNIWNYTPPWPLRRQLIADVITRHDPDVVAIQESRRDFRQAGGVSQADQIAALTGYHATSAVAQVYVPLFRVDEGLALLTRIPPSEVKVCPLTLLPHERHDENHRIVLGAVVEAAGRPIHVFNTHFSLSARARLQNAQEAHRFVDEVSGPEPAVLMGDLNDLPASLPLRFLTGAEDVEGVRGSLTDCWHEAHGEGPGYTYPSSGPVRRIDYILARHAGPGPIQAQLAGCHPRDGVYPSDHLAVVVDLPV
ncbi:MAG TPA: endonuclease/exonuclease/phosphatase family protein [Chloroflexota bacterium]|nr:endonuclease/exonuclease/phosphatase family protein [Chloroflexota bacterium]